MAAGVAGSPTPERPGGTEVRRGGGGATAVPSAPGAAAGAAVGFLYGARPPLSDAAAG